MRAYLCVFVAFGMGALSAFAADDRNPSVVAAVSPAAQQIHYDPATGRLSMQVRDMSLTQVLAQIAQQSGVQILVDPAVERTVTTSMENQPLERGLTKLTRGLNAVMIHEPRPVPGKGQQMVLSTLKLLPQGQENEWRLRPVLSPEAQAILRAKGHDPATKAANDRDRRHLARNNESDQRAKEQAAKDRARADEKARKKAERAEQKAQREQHHIDHLNSNLANIQGLSTSNPDLYAQRMQRINQKLDQIQNGRPQTPSQSQ